MKLIATVDGDTFFSITKDFKSRAYSSTNLDKVICEPETQMAYFPHWVVVFPFARWSDEDSDG